MRILANSLSPVLALGKPEAVGRERGRGALGALLYGYLERFGYRHLQQPFFPHHCRHHWSNRGACARERVSRDQDKFAACRSTSLGTALERSHDVDRKSGTNRQ